MSEQLDALIVGAGPTGLTLGCDLLRRGAKVRVIDAADSGFPGSRAKGLQPRSLEVLDDLGALERVRPLAGKYPSPGIHFWPLTLPVRMGQNRPATDQVPYPNPWLIPQSDTVASLRGRFEELGGSVEFETWFESFEDDGSAVACKIEGPEGAQQTTARFLIGADGGGSTVRKFAGVDFAGSTDEGDRLIVADVLIDGLSRKYWHIWPHLDGRALALCPLPDGEKFQMIIRFKRGEQPDLAVDALKQEVRKLSGLSRVRLREVLWSSEFRPNIRLAAHYRSGNVFLAGDAAHVHTPAGAQGLNTGIQDAYNLGWKIGQVLAGAPESLLDTYQDERRPIAAQVLGMSTTLYKGFSKLTPKVLKRGEELRQLGLNYRGSSLAIGTDAGATLTAGDRAPNARLTEIGQPDRTLFDEFRSPNFTLIAVGEAAIDGLTEIEWPDRGAGLTVVECPGESTSVREAYRVRGAAQILVRPDGYIAYIATGAWRSALESFLPAVSPH